MNTDILDKHLPDWRKMGQAEARARCRKLDPRYRRRAYIIWHNYFQWIGDKPRPSKEHGEE